MEKEYVVQQFKNPDTAFRGKPFWSWNGELEKDELIRQMGILKEMGFGGFFMHSRAGLITEYLGEEWFELINAVADAGEQQEMEAWLYDEDRWPSGSAGGKATIDPQYRMKSLVLHEMEASQYVPNSEDYAVFAGYVDGVTVSEYRRLEVGGFLPTDLPEGMKLMVFRVVPATPESVYNGTTYLDTLSRKATDHFIEITHAAYKSHCGDRIGTSIKGIFTDEPHRGHMLDDLHEENGVRICSIAYTEDIFEEFEKRCGYDAIPLLPELFYRKSGDVLSKVTYDFVNLADDLFLERFMEPMNQWCREHNIDLTGHSLHEDSFSNQTSPQGSLMRSYEHMGVPGVDILTEGNRNYWVAKQLSSAARQVGKEWRLSELYGCTGWQFDFKGHKAVGDWQALFGINLRCPHLSWYTMEGESKRDYPASILHQSTYYKDYNFVESYFARFGFIMSQGRPLCDVLVLNAIESIWGMIHIGWANWIVGVTEEVTSLEVHYAKLFHMLAGGQIDFDYGDEDMMARLCLVERTQDGAILKVGRASYRTVVVSGAVTLRKSTCQLLKQFMECGGHVIFAGEVPAFMDAEPSPVPAELARSSGAICVPFEENSLLEAVRAETAFDVYVTDQTGAAQNKVYVQTRFDDDNGNLYVVVLNTEYDAAQNGLKLTLSDNNSGFLNGQVFAEEWVLTDGARYRMPVRCSDEIVLEFDLDAAGEKVFVLTRDCDQTLAARPVYTVAETKTVSPSYSYRLEESNVCVLDFAAFRFNGSDWQGPLETLKVDRQIRALAGIEFRSGNMLQPWYAKLNDQNVYGDVELRFTFYADVLPQKDCFLAVERPELCSYTMNGTPLTCDDPKDFWIDICFKKLKVPAGLIRKGENEIRMTTSFRRTTNIESIYLVGDFGVKADIKKVTLTSLPETIGMGELRDYNLPFYTGCIFYRIPKEQLPKVAEGQRVLLKAADFVGSLAKVGAAGSSKQQILAWDPYEADITSIVKSGEDLEVTLVPSRRNLFGPLHLFPEIPFATGPEHFTTEGESWRDEYRFVESHLGKVEISVVCEQ